MNKNCPACSGTVKNKKIKSKNMKKIVIIAVIAVLTAGIAAFYGGMKYSQANVSKNFRQNAAVFSRNALGRQNNQPNNNMVSGEIISKEDGSITVKMRDDSSRIIFYDADTDIGKMAKGDSNDLESGKTVFITGRTNQDGSITAQSIQLRPANGI